MAAIIRLSAVMVGRFSSRHMVGCEHRSGPLSGARPTAILNAGSARRRVAVVGVRVAGRDQQHPEADHLGERVVHPLRRPRVGRGSAPGARRSRAGARCPPAAARPRPRSGGRRRRRPAPPCRRSTTSRTGPRHPPPSARRPLGRVSPGSARDRLRPRGRARPIGGDGVDVGAWLRGLGLGPVRAGVPRQRHRRRGPARA